MAQGTDRLTTRRRNRHALQELRDRGALKSGALPPGLRLAMAMFPGLRAPYYGSRGAYAAILGVLFGAPMGGFVALILVLDGQFSPWWAVLGGCLAGWLFGWIYTGYMEAVHRRMKLTPWDRLDNPPGTDTPVGADTFDAVTDDFVQSISRRM